MPKTKTKTIVKKETKKPNVQKHKNRNRNKVLMLMCISTRVKELNQENQKVLQPLHTYQLRFNQDIII